MAHRVKNYKSVTRCMLPLKVAVCVGSRQEGSSLGFIKKAALSLCCEVHHGVVGFYSWPVIGGNYRDAFRSASEVDLSACCLPSCLSISVWSFAYWISQNVL